MVNNIKNNKISEISAKEGLNTLNELKNAEITKHRKRTPKQKELLNLFNDLSDTILTDETLESKSQEKENENKNENESDKNKNENEKKENENEKTLIPSKDEKKKENETINQNISDKIKELNDHLHEIIDKSKSFEEQIKWSEKREDLKGYLPYDNFDDKELKFKYFKIELADMSNEIDKKLFEQIFGHTLETLANKLINTTFKKGNQIIVNNINKNKDKQINFTNKMILVIG